MIDILQVKGGQELLGEVNSLGTNLESTRSSIPTQVSELTNDTGYLTSSDIVIATRVAQNQVMAMDNTVVQAGETYLLVTVNNTNYVVHIPQDRVASDVKMTGYVNTSDTSSVTTTDSVMNAINKLESRIVALEALQSGS